MFFRKIFSSKNHQHRASETPALEVKNESSRPLATIVGISSSVPVLPTTDHGSTDRLLIDKVKMYIRGLEEQRTSNVRYSLRDDWLSDYHAWLSAHSRFKTFRDFILELLQERNLDSVDFYTAAGLDRKLYSRLKNEEGYHPSKETAIRCCLALKLDTSQTEHLLSLAGYSLSWSLHDDLAVRYCIQNRIFNVFDVFEAVEMLK